MRVVHSRRPRKSRSLAPRIGARAVVIAEYSTQWAAMFAEEKAALVGAFHPDAVQVEHVGSTSVPGLGAKPVIDILLGAQSVAAIERHIGKIRGMGYRYVPEFESVFPQRRYFVKPASGADRFHLHAVATGSAFWTEQLAFRDVLRGDAALAREYFALKQRLAAEFADDIDRYTDAKGPFIRGVLDARTVSYAQRKK